MRIKYNGDGTVTATYRWGNNYRYQGTVSERVWRIIAPEIMRKAANHNQFLVWPSHHDAHRRVWAKL